MINRTAFFSYARRAPFGNRLTQSQIDGMEKILGVWESRASDTADIRHLAYILATAFHETGAHMQPVREGFAKTDRAAREVVRRRKYGLEDFTTRQVYYGRGLVQLTWATNYKKMGDLLGVDLYKEPDLALDPVVSAKILVEGMVRGFFTGKKLADFFSASVEDPVGARSIVNGRDKADLIATYYTQFLGAVRAGDVRTPIPKDISEKAAAPDSPALATDKTIIGGLTGVLGAGGAGILGAINNPWAFGALVVVGFGVVLFLTGRLEIRRKAGA